MIYDLRNVTRAYGAGATRVLAVDNLSLAVGGGEFLSIAGPSGSGKSTLLQLLGALDRPTSGEVSFEGKDLGAMSDGDLAALRRDRVGFVFQQFNLIPTLTARQNVEAAMPGRRDRRARAAELLERVGLGARLDNLPTQLSGGEQQRVAIARALCNDPDVLLADEPTGNLDSANGEEIMALLAELNAAGLTLIVITHDPSIAASATRLVRMRDGRVSDEETVLTA